VNASLLTHPFTLCPLCDVPADSAEEFKVADASTHPLYKDALPAIMRWLRCSACGHVFTENYWSEEGEKILFSSALSYQLPDASRSEFLRTQWAPTVRRVAERLCETRGRPAIFGARNGQRQRWLDIGFGNGGLVMVADEFGFAATGVDVRNEAVQRLQALGYGAICASFEHLPPDTSCAVLSMADVLEHLPDPRAALRKASAMLEPDGLLYISCPNRETSTWRLWEQSGTNPYWGELEHYHNFSREKLLELLDTHGFSVIDYAVSVRYYSCMEITARKQA
jgi:SAM-dependent methyltransferase